MIEFCTKRRMIVAIAGLIVISIIVLYVENHMSPAREIHDVAGEKFVGNATYNCWEVAETWTLAGDCTICTAFEQKSIPGCRETGYAETVMCVMKDDTTSKLRRSCPKITEVEEKHFWFFETIAALVGLGSFSIVHMRQKRLDRLLIEKVNRQIANGV